MKYQITIFLIAFTFTKNNCQELTGYITYKQVIVHDTLDKSENTTEGTLYFNATEGNSVYITGRKKNPDQPSKNEYQKKQDGSYSVKRVNAGSKTGKIIFKSSRSKELIFLQDCFGKSYLVKDDYPKINWSILDSSKDIRNLICQKAEGDFRGRHYTAWFTNKIPIADGPWKLCGLPGLILVAYDEKKHFQFEVQTIDFPKPISEPIEVPKLGESIDFLSFYKLQKREVEELPKKMASIITEKGGWMNGLPQLLTNTIERNLEK